jgi:hypothetical protein
MRTPDDPEANQPVFDVDPEFGKMAVQWAKDLSCPVSRFGKSRCSVSQTMFAK